MIATDSPYAMNFESAFKDLCVSTIEILLLSTLKVTTDFGPATDITLRYFRSDHPYFLANFALRPYRLTFCTRRLQSCSCNDYVQ